VRIHVIHEDGQARAADVRARRLLLVRLHGSVKPSGRGAYAHFAVNSSACLIVVHAPGLRTLRSGR
jgi:hypothetical protein